MSSRPTADGMPDSWLDDVWAETQAATRADCVNLGEAGLKELKGCLKKGNAPQANQLQVSTIFRQNSGKTAQHFVDQNQLSPQMVIEEDGSTLMHLVCKMANETTFKSMTEKGVWAGIYLAKDKHGRTPCHYAAINVVKTFKMSVFHEIIQPMIKNCPSCLDVSDKDGYTPLQMLSANKECASLLRGQLGMLPDTDGPPDWWLNKVWAETTAAGGHDFVLLSETHLAKLKLNLKKDIFVDKNHHQSERPASFSFGSPRNSGQPSDNSTTTSPGVASCMDENSLWPHTVIESDGGTMMHLLCKMAAVKVFEGLSQEGIWARTYLTIDKHGRSPLHYAAVNVVKTSNMSVLYKIIQPMITDCPACLHVPDKEGVTPLQVLWTNSQCASELKKGFPISSRVSDSYLDKLWADTTAACGSDYVNLTKSSSEEIKGYLKKGTSPQTNPSQGESGLLTFAFATPVGRQPIGGKTLSFMDKHHVAPYTVIEEDGGTLLHLVCKMAAEEHFEGIRQRGLGPGSYLSKDKHGRTPCHYAAINVVITSKMSVFHAIILPMIRDCPACLNVPDKDGLTPLQVLSTNSECASILTYQMEIKSVDVKAPQAMLSKMWADTTAASDSERIFLTERSMVILKRNLKKDNFAINGYQMSNGNTVNLSPHSVIESDGGTLLHLVCKMAAVKVFEGVIKTGVWTPTYLATDKHGRTPCHYAAVNVVKTSNMSVFYEIIQPMITDCPACLHVPDKDGLTPLQVLSTNSLCASILRVTFAIQVFGTRLDQMWADTTAACGSDYVMLSDTTLATLTGYLENCNPSQANSSTNQNSGRKALSFMEENNVSLHTVIQQDGDTAMHLICKMAAEDAFVGVMQANPGPASFLAKDKNGRIPCHYAAAIVVRTCKMSVFHKMIQPMLQDCPACLHVPDKTGVTPLQVLRMNSECASLLSRE